MKLTNFVATSALLGVTIVAAHAGSQTPQQPPPPLRRHHRQQPRLAAAARAAARQSFSSSSAPPGDPAVIERGRTLYSVTCSACHGADARGGQLGGPNLLRSQLVLADEDGEAIVPVIQGGRPEKGMPPMPAINAADAKASRPSCTASLHRLEDKDRRRQSRHLHQTSSSVTRPRAGVLRSEVHDVSFGDRRSPGDCRTSSRRQDAAESLDVGRRCRGAWRQGRRGRGSSAAALTVTVTTASGEKVEGQLRRLDDFIVTLVQATTERERSFRREGDRPKVEVRDPLQGHRALLAVITEKEHARRDCLPGDLEMTLRKLLLAAPIVTRVPSFSSQFAGKSQAQGGRRPPEPAQAARRRLADLFG